MIKTKRLQKFNRNWQLKASKDVPIFYLSKKNLTDEQINEFLDLILHWCYKTFGAKKTKGIPQIEWMWNESRYQKHNLLGEYDRVDNIILLRIQGHRTTYNLANTLIHEYIHYLQPTKGNWYERYDKKWGYAKNPYEIEAYYLGDLYSSQCVREVSRWMVEGYPPKA